ASAIRNSRFRVLFPPRARPVRSSRLTHSSTPRSAERCSQRWSGVGRNARRTRGTLAMRARRSSAVVTGLTVPHPPSPQPSPSPTPALSPPTGEGEGVKWLGKPAYLRVAARGRASGGRRSARGRRPAAQLLPELERVADHLERQAAAHVERDVERLGELGVGGPLEEDFLHAVLRSFPAIVRHRDRERGQLLVLLGDGPRGEDLAAQRLH